MCGRFNLQAKLNTLLQQFAVEDAVADWQPRFNIAPTQDVLAIRMTDRRQLVTMRWGLIPSWSKDAKMALTNARADTVAEKPAFRSAFKRRRCLIPADGYYEWLRQGKAKLPYLYELGHTFAFAGLWEQWQGIESCTIITTAANELAAEVHDRMPVILDEGDYALWLDPVVEERERLEPILVPYPAERMTARPVSTYVNNARHEGPECIAPE